MDMIRTKAIEMRRDMANVETLRQATLRVDEAERSVRVAAIRLTSLVPGAPLRYGVEATRRLRAAEADFEAARVAYEVADQLGPVASTLRPEVQTVPLLHELGREEG
jgi:hypothetical protein